MLAAAAALVSGGLLALLGLGLSLARPRRPGAPFFGAFLLLWGADLLCFNLSRLAAEGPDALLLARVGFALRIPEALLLVHFAVAYPRAARGAAIWTTAAAALAAAAAVGFALRPEAFLADVARAPNGEWVPRSGAPAALLVAAPFFAAFYLAVHLLLQKHLAAPPGAERRETGIVLGALALYAAYITPFQLLFFTVGWGTFSALVGPAAAVVFALVFAAGAVVLGRLALRLAQRLRRGVAPERRRADLAILAALAVPAAAGLAGAAPLAWGRPPVELLGVFRIAAGALVAYGLLKHQLFGLDLGLKRATRAALPVAAFAAGLAGAAAFAPPATVAAPAVAGVLVGGLAAAVAVPLRGRAADALFPWVGEDEDYRRARAAEVYRAALEQSLARGVDDDPFLRGLRAKLGLSDRDHALVRALVAGGRPPAAPASAAGGRYARERVLAEGGFARVWLARDRVLDRPVVLKELHRPGGAELLREARVAGSLGSPHVVTVHDAFEEDGRACLVLERMEGGSLQDVLDREGRLPRARALAVTADALRGLAALHARGYVHRDVKPGNILLDAEGRAKVADFGITERAPEDGARGATMGAAAPPGTLWYLSPEAADGRRVDARADVYAVGAVLYQTLAGRFYLDFADQGDWRVRRMIREAPPRLPLRGEPEAVNALLARALAKDPAARYADAGAMLADVETVLAAEPS